MRDSYIESNCSYYTLHVATEPTWLQPPRPPGHHLSRAVQFMTLRTILQQRLPQVRLLGVCGGYYADPSLLKHLEGLVRESPVRLLKSLSHERRECFA